MKVERCNVHSGEGVCEREKERDRWMNRLCKDRQQRDSVSTCTYTCTYAHNYFDARTCIQRHARLSYPYACHAA